MLYVAVINLLSLSSKYTFFFLPCFVIIVLDPVNTLFSPNSFNIMLINKGFCKDIANLEQERMGSPFLFQDIVFGVHDSWQTGM